MRRLRKWGLALLVVLGLLSVAGYVGWSWIQQYAHRVVVEQLSDANGAPVTVESVALGMQGIDVAGIRLLELGDDPPAWLTARRLQIAMPIWRAVQSELVFDSIRLEGAAIELRLDTHGRLQNRFPPAKPFDVPTSRVVVPDARLTIKQEGRESLTIDRIVLDVRSPDHRRLDVKGTTGPVLGQPWRVEAITDSRTLESRLKLTGKPIRVDIDTVRGLPLVPTFSAFDVQAGGTVELTAKIVYAPDRPLEYDLKCGADNFEIAHPQLAEPVRRLAAAIRLQNGQLEVSTVRGTWRGATLTGDAQATLPADFSQPVTGRFNLAANNLSLDRLPPAWEVVKTATGSFSGTAAFDVVAGPQSVSVSGSGRGQLDDARLLGLPTQPIQARLQLDSFALDVPSQRTTVTGEVAVELKMEDAEVREVLPRLEVSPESLPVHVAGAARVDAALRVPLQSVRDRSTYAGSVQLDFAELHLGREALKQLKIRGVLAKGVARLEELSGRIGPQGRLNATGSWQPDEPQPAEVTIHLQQAPLATLNGLAGMPDQGIRGDISALLSISASPRRLRTVAGWQARGDLRIPRLAHDKLTLDDVKSRIELKNGRVHFKELAATWQEHRPVGSATVEAAAPHAFRLQLALPRTALDKVASSLPAAARLPDLTGQLSATADIQGTLQPLTWSGNGTGDLEDLKYRDWRVNRLPVTWKLDNQQAEVVADKVAAYGGEFDARLSVANPLNDVGRTIGLDVDIRHVELHDALGESVELPVQPNGRLNGRVEAKMLQDSANRHVMIQWSGPGVTVPAALWPKSTRFAPRDIRFAETQGTATLTGDAVRYEASAQSLGGKWNWQGTARFNELRSGRLAPAGQLSVRGVGLGQLDAAIQRSRRGSEDRFEGQVHADLKVQPSPGKALPVISGEVRVEQLKWQGLTATTATAQVNVDPDALKVRNLQVRLDSGRIDGELTWPLGDSGTGSFQLNARRLDARRVARLLAPDAARDIRGTVGGEVRGLLGNSWWGTAELSLPRTTWRRVRLQAPRLPLSWSLQPKSGRLRAELRESTINVADGRVRMKGTVEVNRGVHVDLRARLSDVEPGQLMASGSGAKSYGKLSGVLELGGRDVQRVRNLRGTFQGTLSQAQALQMPVLRQLNRYLSSGQFASNRFETGVVKLRLANSKVQVEQLALSSAAARVAVGGDVYLNGRLDLDIAAHTGQFEAPAAIWRVVRTSALLAQPAAVAALERGRSLLANRMIYVHVGGTTRSPAVQLQPVRSVQQETIQFFISQGVGAAATTVSQPRR